MNQEQLIEIIVEYFRANIFEKHIAISIKKSSKLKYYNINPIVVKYLSKVIEDNYSPEGVAKALYYPRVLGTSINTMFGTQIQNMFVVIGLAQGSMIKGMDIEFFDKIEKRKKWCQLKSGPNTINSEDVNPLIKKFSDTINLARTNKALADVRNTDFIVGVLYGEEDELSMHYKNINKVHPVYIGAEFWTRLTGYPDFYNGLVRELHVSINNLDTQDLIHEGCIQLTDEIKKSDLFKFNSL
jgi:hypothetical protein